MNKFKIYGSLSPSISVRPPSSVSKVPDISLATGPTFPKIIVPVPPAFLHLSPVCDGGVERTPS